MSSKFKFHFYLIVIISILFTFTSCDPNSGVSYPEWFNDYTGTNLEKLKSAQDEFECFGNTIGSKIISNEINYDPTAKYFMATFKNNDSSALVDETDIKPFKDGAIANGFTEYSNPYANTYTYEKDNIEFTIYVIRMTGDDHFEVIVEYK